MDGSASLYGLRERRSNLGIDFHGELLLVAGLTNA
jgi:hypothetical protein